MSKIKKMFKNVRIIMLLIFLALAIVAIHPAPDAQGVAIRSVIKNSSASDAGIQSPKPTDTPMSREIILAMNNVPIIDEAAFHDFTSTLEPNRTVQIKTNKGFYRMTTRPIVEIVELNETETVMVEKIVEINETINGTVYISNKTVQEYKTIPKTQTLIHGVEDIGISVYEAPKNNIRKGLDLQGGTRVLLEPEKKLDQEDMETLLSNMKERLNVFGLTDVVVRKTTDLSGGQFILVEIAGANEDEVRELIAKQGKFEAKIGNDTVFVGGSDITYVCRSADCSGIDPQTGCGRNGEDWACSFRFAISLTPESARRQADITSKLDVITEGDNDYLSQQLDLYLDDQLVDSLNIGADLKGQPQTDIAISGPGVGITREEASFEALKNMKRLQTILVTGSLPVKLNIVKTDAISPVLGDEFVKNALLIGVIAILSVGAVVFIRYRKLEIAVPMMCTMVSEVILLLGLAALVSWNLDLAAVAGIIIAAGTGVDDQIVITDEILRGEGDITYNWKQKIKKAFFIIMAAYFTTVVAMVPLLFAGAGLIKGFAFTTIAGVSFGVFLTRPAFAAVAEILLKK